MEIPNIFKTLPKRPSLFAAHLTKKFVRVSEIFVEDFQHNSSSAEGRFSRVRNCQQEALL